MAVASTQTPVRAPVSITGYHGCEASVATRLLDGEPFRLSTNDYDWLGSGVYFWEYAPYRAREWAKQRYGSDWAVVGASIRPGDCLNLLDTDYFGDLRSVHARIAANFERLGVPTPVNHRGANRLDRLIIDEFCQQYTTFGGYFDTVRGCFAEGTPVFDGSKLLSHTHVQIAVRNPACIGTLKLVHYT
ncbi:MAG: hypothetical protein ACLQVD_01210 [Capsulimonadaceae bacterium]